MLLLQCKQLCNNINIINVIIGVFQHLTATNLQLSVISDHVSLERDLFLNLGSVQNLSLDMSSSVVMLPNTTTAELANPATKYSVGVPTSVFLKDLNLGQKAYPCNCASIGYVCHVRAICKNKIFTILDGLPNGFGGCAGYFVTPAPMLTLSTEDDCQSADK